MELRPGYKLTEVGVIPEDWDARDLGSIGEALIGLTYSPVDVVPDGLLVLRSSNIDGGALRFDDNVFVALKVPDRIIVREGDILICVRNGSRDLIGKCAKITPEAQGMTFGAFMAVFRSSLNDFVFQQFRSGLIRRQIQEHLGATINQITNRSLNAFQISLPKERGEQIAIAGALGDVDTLLEALNKLTAKKRDLNQAAMQQLLTGRTRLPGFTRRWETRLLGEALEKVVGGGTPSRSNPSFWGAEIPWVTVKDFASFQPRQTQEAITWLGLRHSASNLIPKGTLIVATRMAVGKSVVYDVDVCINQDLKALFPKQDLSVSYLRYWFVHHAERIAELGSGSTVKGISIGDLNGLVLQLPPLGEQAAVVAALSDMEAEIAALENRLAKTRALKAGMMQELLTGRIRLVEPPATLPKEGKMQVGIRTMPE